MRKSIVAAFAAALTTTSALAADKGGPAPEPVIGLPASVVAPSCYVQALAGSSVNTIKAKEADALPASLSVSGWTLGAGVGCDVRLDRIVIGALARVELPVDTDGSLIKSDQSWMAAARFGYMLNTGLLVYGLVGMTQPDWKVEVEKLSKDGIVLGGGIEAMITKQLSFIAEYTQTNFGKTHIEPISIEPTAHAFRLGLTYRFGDNSIFGDCMRC